VSVGETLAAGRREAGMSLDDVASITRLRPAMIAAIENDDFTLSGADSYARGHVRSIAQAIGIDPDAVVAEFDASRAASTPSGSMRKDFESGRRSIDDAPRAPDWNRVIAFALVVLVALLIIAIVVQARR